MQMTSAYEHWLKILKKIFWEEIVYIFNGALPNTSYATAEARRNSLTCTQTPRNLCFFQWEGVWSDKF